MFNYNNKTIEALQRHVDPFIFILLLLSSLVCLSGFVFDVFLYSDMLLQFSLFHFIMLFCFFDLN